MSDRKPSNEDWDAMLTSLELGLAALGIPAPLQVARRVLKMIKRNWTQDGRLALEYEHERALALIEEAIDPLAGAALELGDDIDDIKRGQDQIVELLLRVLRERKNLEVSPSETESAFFEGPRRTAARSVPHFRGRDEELAALEQLLLSDNHTVCVVASGIGGIGKTTLAEEFVATRTPELFSGGVAWLDGGQLVTELGRVSRRFGWIEDREPTPAEAVSLLSTNLHTKPVLLVVDNFDPDDGDCEHVPRPGGQCRTLVTSRSRTLDVDLDAVTLELQLWSPEACREYLRGRCPRLISVGDAEVDELTEFVGWLPLGVRLLVSLLQRRRGLAVADVLRTLRAQPLDTLDKYKGAHRGIAATFQFSFEALTDNGRRVLQALAVCATRTRSEVVEAVAGVGDVGELLDDLHARGIAELADEAGIVWGLHDVICMFVLAQPDREGFEAAHTAWVRAHLEKHSAATAHREFGAGTDEARRACERLLHTDIGQASPIYRALEEHLRVVGRYSEATALSQSLLQAAPTDSELIAEAMNNLGICYQTLGNIPMAIESLECSLAIEEKLGRDLGQACALGNLGTCYRSQGDISKAIDFHERSLAINTKLGNLENQALQIGNLGLCYQQDGYIPKAIEFIDRALAINEQLGNLPGQAIALGNLAFCHQLRDDISTSIRFHERSLAIDEQLGHLQGQGTTLCNLGSCYHTLGDISKAMSLHERALSIFEKVGHPEGQAATLGRLGACYRTLGDISRAIDFHERSLAINTTLGNLDGLSTALCNLGGCYHTRGDIPKAIEIFERALAVAETIGSPRVQATVLNNLGMTAAKVGNLAEARDYLTRALALNRRMGLPDSHADSALLLRVLSALPKR